MTQALGAGAATEQGLGVDVLCLGKNLLHWARLAHLAVAHDYHLVGDFAHQAQVVGDKEHGHFAALAQLGQQLHDLALHRHVQRSGRLIGDQQLGLAGQGHGDHHPLLLAA